MEVANEGKKKEAFENAISIHKILSHQHTIKENEEKSDHKTVRATNASLTTRGACQHGFIDGITKTSPLSNGKPLP